MQWYNTQPSFTLSLVTNLWLDWFEPTYAKDHINLLTVQIVLKKSDQDDGLHEQALLFIGCVHKNLGAQGSRFTKVFWCLPGISKTLKQLGSEYLYDRYKLGDWLMQVPLWIPLGSYMHKQVPKQCLYICFMALKPFSGIFRSFLQVIELSSCCE